MAKRSTEQTQESQRRTASFTLDVANLMADGGPEPFLTEYLDFLHEIKEAEHPHNFMAQKLLSDLSPVNEGKPPISQKFPRQKVQIAAMVLQGQISKLKSDEHEERHKTLSQMAKEAYINAAGHHVDDKNLHMPQFTEEADARRKEAEKQWKIYSKSNIKGLYEYIIFPDAKVIGTLDHVAGIGIIIIFVIIIAVIIIYYN